MQIFAEFTKADEATRMVYGYASTEALDAQDERVSKAAIEAALPDYMRFANIREMHQASAVGVTKEASIDDKGLFIAAKVVDADAWEKVQEGVYKGFSIGGKATTKVDGEITALRLSEISLVDRPANPDCVFTMFKGEDVEPAKEEAVSKKDEATPAPAANPAVDALAAMLNKGEISPERLVELAKADAEAKAAKDAKDDEDKKDEAAAPAPGDEDKDAEAKPKDEDKAKAEMPDLKKYMGEEVWDARQAVEALGTIMFLLCKEMDEDEANAAQVADLKEVAARLKSFIASEIQEDNSAADALALADMADDLAKAGARHGKVDKAHLAAIHKSLVALGHDCTGQAEKADGADDIAKADLGDRLQKALGDLDVAKARITALEDEPAAAKGIIKAVPISKAADNEQSVDEGPDLSKMSDDQRALHLIKKAQAQPQYMALV